MVRLRIKAFVKRPIHIFPRRIHLYGKEGQILTRALEVRGELDKPLKLIPSQFNLAEKVTYAIEEIEKDRRFKIRFTSIPGSPLTFRGFLKLRTNYPEKPEITIWIKGRFSKEARGGDDEARTRK